MRRKYTSAPVQDAKKGGPIIHYCGADGCGKPFASCGIGGQWFCVPCVPADFWPHHRVAA